MTRPFVVVALAACIAVGREAGATVARWSPVAGGPGPRSFAAAAAAGGHTLLFGGTASSTPLGDTWSLTGPTWTLVSANDAEAPTARYGAVMAYDAADGVFVLFGGTDATQPFLGDTYEWNAHWVRRSTSGPARVFASAAYDPTLNRVVMFGGHDAGGASLPQAFAWDHATGSWTPLPLTGTPPSRRERAGLAWDGLVGRLALYGGLNGFVPFDNAYQIKGGAWSGICIGCTTVARSALGWAGGPTGLVLFGGGAPGTVLGDTKVLAGTAWSDLVAITPTPAPRFGHAFVYDDVGKRFLSVGGSDAAGDRPDVSWQMILLGNPCAADADCATGHCPSPEHVCCLTACTEDCHRCDLPAVDPPVVDGICRAVADGKYPDECLGDARECHGTCVAGKCQNPGPEQACGAPEKCHACNKDTRKCTELPLSKDDSNCGDTTGKCTLASGQCRTYDDPQKVVHRCLDVGKCAWQWSDCVDATLAADGAACSASEGHCADGYCGQPSPRMQMDCPSGGCGSGCGGCGGDACGARMQVTWVFAADVDRSKISDLYYKASEEQFEWFVTWGCDSPADFTQSDTLVATYCSKGGKGTPLALTLMALDAAKHLLALGQADGVVGTPMTVTLSATTPLP